MWLEKIGLSDANDMFKLYTSSIEAKLLKIFGQAVALLLLQEAFPIYWVNHNSVLPHDAHLVLEWYEFQQIVQRNIDWTLP